MKISKLVTANDLSQNSQRGELPGLLVSHNLIEGLGGRVEVANEPGKGSTFRVVLNGVNRRLPNCSPSKLADYVRDIIRLIIQKERGYA